MINQLKIITTAVFSVIILRRYIFLHQWVALILLFFGVVLVEPLGAPSEPLNAGNRIGVLAGLAATILSGFTGVFIEKILQESTLCIRNIQLGIYSIFFLFFALLWKAEAILAEGFFIGYTKWTWLAILCSAASGLLISMIVKHLGSISKNFASCFAILLGAAFSLSVTEAKSSAKFFSGRSAKLASSVIIET